MAKEFADMKYQRLLSSTRSSTQYVYHSQSKERESDSECCTLLRKMLSFSNGCSQFVQNMNTVRILNLIDFRLLHSHITFKI